MGQASGGTSTTAVVGVVLAALSFVVALCSFAVAAATRRAAARAARMEHVRGVTVFHAFVVGNITATNHDEVVLRNDGRHAVTVRGMGIVYGRWWASERHQPEAWATQQLVGAYLLPPGQELRAPMPDPVVNTPMIGPIASVTDALGQRWEVTETTRRPFTDETRRRPRRRDAWFERRHWWPRLDEAVESWWIRRSERRPWLFPWFPLIVGFVWGWRVGVGSRTGMPLNAPIGWRYAPGAHFDVPDVPLPTYVWKKPA